MPVDPVCGIEMDEDIATIHEFDGKKYFFCCNGCRKIFMKKPKKYKKNVKRGNEPHIRQNFELGFILYIQLGHLDLDE